MMATDPTVRPAMAKDDGHLLGPGATDARPSAVTARLGLSPRCPYRPPWWRWERAGRLAAGGRRERWDDPWVARARRLLVTMGREGGWSERRGDGADPAALGAHR